VCIAAGASSLGDLCGVLCCWSFDSVGAYASFISLFFWNSLFRIIYFAGMVIYFHFHLIFFATID
jgi:hypothetical protein